MRISNRRAIRAAHSAAVACLAVLLALPAVAEVFEGLPDVIKCTIVVPEEEERVVHLLYYVSSQMEGVHTRYKSLGARSLQLTISNDGKVMESSKGSCENKSLAQLKESGQAFTFGENQ